MAAASLRRVAAEAGFTMGALTHYFSDRDALLVAALRATHFAAGARMLAAARRAGSPRERLEAILLEALPLDDRRQLEWRVWLAFWGEAIAQPALMAENAKRYAEWTTLVRTALSDWPDPASAQALSIVARIDGFGMRLSLAGHDPAAAAEIRRAAVAEVALILGDLDDNRS